MKATLSGHARLLIGLTGTYCAGKNHVAALLEARGFPVLDVDTLGHEALELERERILMRFGTGILGKDGRIDRRLLGVEVFGSPAALAWLESVVHPRANRLTEAWIDRHADHSCVINAALLHRSSIFHRLDGILVVRAPVLIRLLRARKRDALPWGELIRRFKSQREFMAKYLQKPADTYSIINRGYGRFGSAFLKRSLERQLEAALTRLGRVQDVYLAAEK
ncbi:MAG: dephospho-CoA kinase [Spirochaetaceae bacterium]|jgi:dephospho-CoA kinase|nr:dephospho-CoA kinase [Spirochaetaceae bacterium]